MPPNWGWALQLTLEAKSPVGALKMALQTRKKKTELVHHSDRGVQGLRGFDSASGYQNEYVFFGRTQ